ncbi:MAG TPA: GspE/PulE family protein, partial [Candidatus Saccharimonadales bacterium]|nr:GspE/PulE family protein [Candidatus Saccharimonadales bacterium]
AALLGLDYADSRQLSQTAPLIANVLSLDEMYKTKLVPLEINTDNAHYLFAITSSTPQSVITKLREDYQNQGKIADFVLISDLGFKEFMNRYDPPKEVIYDDVKLADEGDSSTLDEVSQTLESVSTDKILDYLINQADKLGASDIHIESQRDNVRLRLRVDGLLHPVATISHDKYRVLLGSIATRANISTASAHPQSGHMQQTSTNTPDKLINMRIETVTTAYGVDCVIRLFDFDESLLSVDSLGLDDKRRQAIEDIIAHPHGMLMVVGPTGSGKSTTLYSILNALNSPNRKILTLEDPVEVALPGVSQIPINADNGTGSFAEGLRAILRLDPDVVMVGEIRDEETARTAIQASITGHLVLSTFHASSAAAAFSRMIDMIGQNPIFANAIRMVVAQRLVRRLDDDTKTEYEPDESTKTWIRQVLRDLPEGIDKPDLDNIKLYQPGQSADSPFGYRGRIMIMEQLTVTDQIQKFIRGEMKDIDVEAIEQAANAAGMLTMEQDGVLRALRGDTTIEEINRVL